MKEYLDRLSERDRLLLMLAAAAVIILLVFAGWHSFASRVDRMHDVLSSRQATLAYMKQAAQQVRQLRGNAPVHSSTGQSLMALLDSTARQSGLHDAVKRVDPDGQDKVRLRLEQAGFDDMLRWLESLNRSYGITVENITIDRLDSIGLVNARLTLTGASA